MAKVMGGMRGCACVGGWVGGWVGGGGGGVGEVTVEKGTRGSG